MKNVLNNLKQWPNNVKQSCKSWNLLTFQQGDVDGFTQLVMNNIGTTLVIAGMLNVFYDPRNNGRFTEEYTILFTANPQLATTLRATIADYVFSRTVIGLALAITFGSIYYAWLALRLKSKDTGSQPTALPFGVNTPAAFAFTLGILIPIAGNKFNSCYDVYKTNQNIDNLSVCLDDSINSSWKTGVLSNFAAGLIGVILAFFGSFIVKVTPRVALLTSLGTIGIAFLLLSQLCLNFADPLTGMLPIGLMIMGFFCGVRYWKISTTIVVVVVGSALSWASGMSQPSDVTSTFQDIRWTPPTLGISALGDWSSIATYFGTIFPFAIQASVGTLMNVQSALKAGDNYPVRESMIIDGFSSMLGAIFGTPMMSSVYIGHPGFKSMGATTSYPLMSAGLYLVFALFGMFALINGLLPPAALAPVIAFIGLIICSDAMDGIPVRHHIVFLLGLLPGICDWAVQNGMFAQGTAQWGYLALGGPNAMLYSMILGSIVAYSTDKNFIMACMWSIFAAFCSGIGLIHQDTLEFTSFAEPHGSYCIILHQNGLLNHHASSAWTNLTGTPVCKAKYMPCANGAGCGFVGITQWRFMASYLMLATPFALLFFMQKSGKFLSLRPIDCQKELESLDENESSRKPLSSIDDEIPFPLVV